MISTKKNRDDFDIGGGGEILKAESNLDKL